METVSEVAASTRGDIQVVSRLAALLDCITATAPALDIQRAADVLGVGRSTAHRYLASMEKSALLQKDASGKYVLGPVMVRLGAIAFSGSGLIDAAGPLMTGLAAEIPGTIVLSVWGGDAPVVARVERNTRQTTTVAVDVGRSLGPESAQSLVFGAFRARRDGQPHEQEGVSTYQIDEGGQRRDVLIARHTYAEGALKVIAVPVLSRGGDIVATLAILGFGASLPDTKDDVVIIGLITAARKLQTS